MEVKVNNQLFEVPFDIDMITLGQFLEYYAMYGRDLDAQLKSILEPEGGKDDNKDDFDQYIDLDNHIDREAIAWFSFWTKHDLTTAGALPEMQMLLAQYRVLRVALDESVKKSYDYPLAINWAGDEWEITDYKVNAASNMSFNEIITSKEVMRQIKNVGQGRWEALPYLCCVFLRKKGEAFSDELIEEEGERMTMFRDLPLTHAMQVAFFLNVCVCTWRRTLVSSEKVEEMENLP